MSKLPHVPCVPDALHGVIQLHGAAGTALAVDWLRPDQEADETVIVRVGEYSDVFDMTLFFDSPAQVEAWASAIVDRVRALAFGANVESHAAGVA
ncbi:MAG: hypothetical protein QM733_18910 [Ilumatobacteraceae bacterium]